MKKLILLLMPVALLFGQSKKAAPKVSAAPAPQADSQKIPAGAKQIEPFFYSYTDAQGKKWIYRQTPFGVVKWEDKPAVNTPVVEDSNPVVITDLGDSVRFQWKTPFGDQQRVAKKSELTDDEKAMIQNQQAKLAGSPAKADAALTKPAAKAPEKQ